ncbi:MAG: AbrB/MazE/SpoVT family DNA-binding domain-containing protein [Candidatus Micrarchaeota archaeon]|nr:AbrB/MazE/SpoVT family DNA-binding domain-containing protein [Candidatus Micrarchaeota archaeon]
METETIEITKASSKGQIVIPENIRKKLKIQKGSFFMVTSKKSMIVMKKLDPNISKADLKTLKGVEEAWKDIEHGRYKVLKPDEFSRELDKW